MLWINLGNTISKRQHRAHTLALAAQSPSPLSGINGCGPLPPALSLVSINVFSSSRVLQSHRVLGREVNTGMGGAKVPP